MGLSLYDDIMVLVSSLHDFNCLFRVVGSSGYLKATLGTLRICNVPLAAFLA
jgi:hypothetical protein